MAKYCVKRNIEALEAQYENGKLFSSELKKCVFDYFGNTFQYKLGIGGLYEVLFKKNAEKGKRTEGYCEKNSGQKREFEKTPESVFRSWKRF